MIAEASLTRGDPFAGMGAAANDTDQAPALDFRTLFERYSQYVATIAFRLLGRNDEVDDVVQDVFLQVHRRLSTIRPDAVRGWLAVVTVRGQAIAQICGFLDPAVHARFSIPTDEFRPPADS